jgi:predicted permease
MRDDGTGERGGVFSRPSIRDDVDREIWSHLSFRTEELIARGWSPEEARREAARLLGDRLRITEACVDIVRRHQRAVRRATMMDAILQDLRFGWRSAIRSPGFALVALLTLALGIGANTAIFSVVQGVLFEPLGFDEPEELVVVWENRQDGGTMSVAWPNFVDWREQSPSFSELFAYAEWSTTVLGGATPVVGQAATVTSDIWPGLRLVPVEGRVTTAADHVSGAEPVVVVSRGFWQNELGGRPIDQLLLDVDFFQARVVGVIADSDAFPTGTQLWLPVELSAPSLERSSHNHRVVGRLAPGVTLERAAVEIDELTRRLVQAEPDEYSEFLAAGATVRSLREQLVGDARTPLLMLLGAAGLVLLVACTNLASTLLARGTNRARELAVRASLGAGTRRIVRQLVTESVVLALGGAAAGLGLAAALLAAVERFGPASIPRLDQVGIDGTALLYTFGIAVLTVLLFGLFPALGLTRGDRGEALRSGARGNAGRSSRVWTLLVGSEVALALVLLVGSGLLIRSFRTLLDEDVGMDGRDVLTMPVALSNVEYGTAEAHARWYDEALAALGALPGVSGVGLVSTQPLAGFLPNGRLELDGDLDLHAVAGYVATSGGAFAALDVPLLAGRTFEPGDTPDQPHVAIVSASFAGEYWPGQDPIGRLVTGGGMDSFYQDRRFARVVGVVGDVRFRSLGEPPVPTVYFPYTQRPSRIRYSATLVVEAAAGAPTLLAPAIRSTIQGLEPDVPIRLAAYDELVGDSVAARRFTMLLLTGFSFVALVLAVVGIYGVVSYSVARRTREMGIRVALGADPGAVLGLVMRSSMAMVGVGLAIGVVGAVLAGRVMRGLLYGIGALDPLALLGGVVVLAASALVATWMPARRGTRVDPMVTMRAE